MDFGARRSVRAEVFVAGQVVIDIGRFEISLTTSVQYCRRRRCGPATDDDRSAIPDPGGVRAARPARRLRASEDPEKPFLLFETRQWSYADAARGGAGEPATPCSASASKWRRLRLGLDADRGRRSPLPGSGPTRSARVYSPLNLAVARLVPPAHPEPRRGRRCSSPSPSSSSGSTVSICRTWSGRAVGGPVDVELPWPTVHSRRDPRRR